MASSPSGARPEHFSPIPVVFSPGSSDFPDIFDKPDTHFHNLFWQPCDCHNVARDPSEGTDLAILSKELVEIIDCEICLRKQVERFVFGAWL
jgi:hypothetical protein